MLGDHALLEGEMSAKQLVAERENAIEPLTFMEDSRISQEVSNEKNNTSN